MFSPSTVFNVGGTIKGVDVNVTISATALEVDASQHAHAHPRTIVDVHNIATMLVVAVNTILKGLQEDALHIVTAPPAAVVEAPPSPRARLLEFQGREDKDDDDEPPTTVN